MKHPGLLLGLLLTIPLTAATGDAPVPKHSLTLGERVTLLEEFATQQKDYNHQVDEHMTRHVDDILRSQGVQDEKIAALQSKEAVIYSIGELLAWCLALAIPAGFGYAMYRAKESKERHQELKATLNQFDLRFQSIESSLLVLHTQLGDHLQEDKS